MELKPKPSSIPDISALSIRHHQPLPIMLELAKGESLLSYIMRLSEANLHGSPNWIVQRCQAEANHVGPSFVAKVAAGLANQFHFDRDALAPTWYPLGGSTNHLHVVADDGSKLEVCLLNIKFPSLCPACLAEYGVAFKMWDLKALKACPRHNTQMLSKCDCGAMFAALRPELKNCKKCGKDLRKLKAPAASFVEASVARLLASKFLLPFKVVVSSVASEWSVKPLGDLLANLSLLYRFHPLRPHKHKPNKQVDWSWAANNVGQCIVDWPEGYHHYLSTVRHHTVVRPQQRQLGLSFSFGRFYQRVTTEDKGRKYFSLKEELARYIAADNRIRLVVNRRNSLGEAVKCRVKRFYTKNEVCRELNIGSAKFMRLWDDGFLKGEKLAIGKRQIFSVTFESMEDVRGRLHDCWGASEIEANLYISKKMLKQLIELGHIHSLSYGASKKCPRITLSSDEIRSYLYRISIPHRKSVRLPASRLLTLRDAFIFSSKSKWKSGKAFLHSIWSGEVRPRSLHVYRDIPIPLYLEWDILRASGRQSVGPKSIARVLGFRSSNMDKSNFVEFFGLNAAHDCKRTMVSIAKLIEYLEHPR